MLLRSTPIRTLSLANSKSFSSTAVLFNRAASSAASFTRFSRSAPQAGAAQPADGVDLIDKDDARGVLLALLEQVAHTGGAHADEHLHEVRAADAEERHARFANARLGQEGLARPRRADDQDALRNAPAQLLEFMGIFEELDDLDDL